MNMKWWHRLSFRLTGFLLLLSIVPLGGFGILAIGTIRHMRTTDIEERQGELAYRCVQQIASRLSDTVKEVQLVIRSYELEVVGEPDQEWNLQFMIQVLPHLHTVTLVDRTGRERIKVGRDDVYNPGDLKNRVGAIGVLENKNGRPEIGNFHRKAHNLLLLDVFFPLMNLMREEAVGVLAAEINVEKLLEFTTDLRLGETGYVYVVNSDGRIIVHPDHSVVLAEEDALDNPLVRGFVSDRQVTKAGRTYVKAGRREFMTRAEAVPDMDLLVVVEQSSEEITAAITATLKRQLVILGGTLAAVILLALYFKAKVDRPLRRLTAGAQRFGEGRLDTRIPVTSSDEIGKATQAFNNMAEELESRTLLIQAGSIIFSEAMTCETREEVAGAALRMAEEMTASRFGFIGEINNRGTFDTIALSDPGWAACRLSESEALVQIRDMEIRGIWGDCLTHGGSRIVNHPESYPGRTGVPAGHPELTSFLGVPLKQGEEIFGLIALANKPGGYDARDETQIETLSVTVAEALRRKAEQVELRKHRDHLEDLVQEQTRELRRSHDQSLALFDGIDDVIYVADPETYELLYVNETAKKIWGEDIVGRKCYRVLQDREAPCPYCTNEFIFGEYLGRPYIWEFQNETTGEWFRCADKAIQWPDGRMARFELASNITGMKQAQADLEAEKQFSNTLIDSLPGVFYMFNRELRFVRWNRNFETVTGYSGEEIASMTPLELFTGEDREIISERIGRVFTEGQATAEAAFTTKSGGRVPHMFTGILMEAGGIPYLAGVGIDITEKKEAEEQLLQLNADLERSNRELEQFAYVASHDLQEPLRMVSSFTQLLAKRYRDKLDEDGREFIDYAVDGANRMQRLIQDLLRFSRVTTRGKPPVDVDARDVLDEALSNLQVLVAETGAQVTADQLPTIRADRSQLVQVFQNLVHNAVKFRREEEPPRIHVTAEEGDDEWTFSVRDNGIGIENKHHDRIFTIFQKLHTRQSYSGTGIGLALCKRIVERHGGKTGVTSEPGTGTTFFFTLKKET